MITLGLDFVVIKDNRGYEGGFFWSDVQQVIGVHDDVESVKVKFRDDREGAYTVMFEMPVTEFLAEVKEQLNHPDKLYKDDEEFLSPAHNEILTFNIDGIQVKVSRGDVWMARESCTGGCVFSSYCPFFGKPDIEVGAGCRRIFDAYDDGQYTVSNGMFEEDDE
jgi:hypothetical protein